MSTAFCFNSFKEYIDHEFKDYKHIKILSEGYRVDNNGIKNSLKLNEFKSVDYFIFTPENFIFVEFSDLFSQRKQDLDKIEKLKSSNLDRKTRIDLTKDIDKTIQKEIIDKFKDSLKIKDKSIDESCCNFSISKDAPSELTVVVAPLTKETDSIEFVKYLDTLKNNITSSLPNSTITKVTLIPLNKTKIFEFAPTES